MKILKQFNSFPDIIQHPQSSVVTLPATILTATMAGGPGAGVTVPPPGVHIPAHSGPLVPPTQTQVIQPLCNYNCNCNFIICYFLTITFFPGAPNVHVPASSRTSPTDRSPADSQPSTVPNSLWSAGAHTNATGVSRVAAAGGADVRDESAAPTAKSGPAEFHIEQQWTG